MVLCAVAVSALFLVAKDQLVKYVTSIPKITQLVSTNPTPTPTSAIIPEETYANPFDKKTQYVNPFNTYKNPFDNL